jgi:hypothetical protein
MIKNHKNKNDYLMHEGVLIRDLTKENVTPVDINNLYSNGDYQTLLTNEQINNSKKNVSLDYEAIRLSKVIIISDGFGFNEVHKEFHKLPRDVTIIAVNGALKNWKLVGKDCPEENKKAINYYVVNNPYEECMWFLPRNHSYYPRCIASSKTNHEFLKKYDSEIKYIYNSTPDNDYSGLNTSGFNKFDDYRNPICAALALSYSFGVRKIAILCHDESYKDFKEGMIKTESGNFCYPQQIKSKLFIEGMCYWLTRKDIAIANNSKSLFLKNTQYIESENLVNFFEE